MCVCVSVEFVNSCCWRSNGELYFFYFLLLLALSEIIICFKNKEFWFYLLISSSTLSGLQSGLCRDTVTLAIHILCTFLRIYLILYVFYFLFVVPVVVVHLIQTRAIANHLTFRYFFECFFCFFYDYWSNITGFSGVFTFMTQFCVCWLLINVFVLVGWLWWLN